MLEAERNVNSGGLDYEEEREWIQAIHAVFDKESGCILLMP